MLMIVFRYSFANTVVSDLFVVASGIAFVFESNSINATNRKVDLRTEAFTLR